MAASRLTPKDLYRLSLADRLNVIPVLMLLHALDDMFPTLPCWIDRYLEESSWGTLHIHFNGMRTVEHLTGSTHALLNLAHDVWNGDVKTQMREVLSRCDERRRKWVIYALIASYEEGRGAQSMAFIRNVLGVEPNESED